MLTYYRIRGKPRLFKSFFGVTVAEFDTLYVQLLPVWSQLELQRLGQRQRQRAIGGGRTYGLSLRDRLLMTLLWLKLYLNNDVLGYLFGVDAATASRNVRNILPALRVLGEATLGWPPPPQRGETKNLAQALQAYPDLLAIVDATEQQVRRSSDNATQREHYSGKKKGHTRKTQIIVNEKGVIRAVSTSTPGRVHDFDMAVRTRQRQAHFLGRLPAHVKPQFVKALPAGSYLAYIYPSAYQRKKRGEHLLVRIIAYTIDDPQRSGHGELHRLMTSLLDPGLYSAHLLACEYHQRWEVEITIDEVNTHQRLPHIPWRSQKPAGVIQEAYGLLLAHYAVRAIMHEAAVQNGLNPDRLSFINALRIMRETLSEFQMTTPEQLPRLYQRLLQDIARHRLPERDQRSNPRVVKRKMSKFNLKREPHRHWPQPSRTFQEAIVLLN